MKFIKIKNKQNLIAFKLNYISYTNTKIFQFQNFRKMYHTYIDKIICFYISFL